MYGSDWTSPLRKSASRCSRLLAAPSSALSSASASGLAALSSASSRTVSSAPPTASTSATASSPPATTRLSSVAAPLSLALAVSNLEPEHPHKGLEALGAPGHLRRSWWRAEERDERGRLAPMVVQ